LDVLLYITGFLAGILSGMGVGGGSLLVPVLLAAGQANQTTAQGVCLASFLPVAFSAVITHFRQKQIDVSFLPKLLPWAVTGAVLGALGAGWLPLPWLRGFFGAFLCLLGGYEFLSGFFNGKGSPFHPDESKHG
jgi:uncharacterized membrane protein YfcA